MIDLDIVCFLAQANPTFFQWYTKGTGILVNLFPGLGWRGPVARPGRVANSLYPYSSEKVWNIQTKFYRVEHLIRLF